MFRRRLLALGLVAVVAACGGGGGSGSSAPPLGVTPTSAPTSAPTTIPQGSASASFAIAIPLASASAARRHGKNVSPLTQAIRFTLLAVNGTPTDGTPGPIQPLNASQSYCSSSGTTTLTCHVPVVAPVGADIYDAETYADTAGTSKLGSGDVAISVQANATNSASLTLSGTIDHVALGASSGYLGVYDDSAARRVPHGALRQHATLQRRPASASRAPLGSASPAPLQTIRLYVIAFDAQNNIILDPSNYSTPVTLYWDSYDYDGGPGLPISVTVQHEDGSGAPVTTPQPSASQDPEESGLYSVQVLAPGDQITAALNPAFTGFAEAEFLAMVGSAAPSETGNDDNSVQNYQSIYIDVPGPSPTPSPTPTPVTCPSGTTWNGDVCVPNLYWNGIPANTTIESSTFVVTEIPSVTSTQMLQYVVAPSDPNYTGTVTLAADPAGGSGNAAACANLQFASGYSQSGATAAPVTIAYTGGAWPFTAALVPTPSAGFGCALVVTGDNATLQLQISVNNVTGTIQ